MKPVKFAVLLFVVVFLNPDAVLAQDKKGGMDMVAYTKRAEQFFNERIGETFEPLDSWTTIDGEEFDLGQSHIPTILFLGFSSCPPCRQALPYFAELSAKEQYKNVNFIYITFDDSTTIRSEFKESGVNGKSKVKFISLTRKYLAMRNMAYYGFPTIYFLDAKNTLKLVDGFGKNNGPLNKEETWVKMIQSVE